MPTQSTQPTPMMQQWFQCKESAKDAILLFRLGDFYESFYEDAEKLAATLNLTLTKRQNIPMAGIPQVSAEGYIERLVGKGFRVAIAEQISDPKATQGIVKRAVTQIVTPSTILSENIVPPKEHSFIASIYHGSRGYSLSLCDISTGLFFCSFFSQLPQLLNEIHKLSPKEIIIPSKNNDFIKEIYSTKVAEKALVSKYAHWKFEYQYAKNCLKEQFEVASLQGFGLEDQEELTISSGALISYLKEELTQPTSHIQSLSIHQNSQYLAMDSHTLSNLEVLQTQDGGSSLFSILDNTQTAMGGRLLAQWLRYPLTNPGQINERQEGVKELIEKANLKNHLKQILDVDRLTMKLASHRISPRECVALKQSLANAIILHREVKSLDSAIFTHLWPEMDKIEQAFTLFDSAINDPAPIKLGEGLCFKPSYHQELNELIHIKQNSKEWIQQYQETMRKKLDIKTLKVGFNRTFGYYIEVSKGQSSKVPTSYHRRQTLVNAERYISDELKVFEQKILSAEEKIQQLETQLYSELLISLNCYIKLFFKLAKAISIVDVLNSFATSAQLHQYVCPQINSSDIIHIVNGKHPIVEQVHTEEAFIANDTKLNNNDNQMMLITGPNMAGKSTYIRQVALLVLMAQTGSFIPATRANICIVDQIFTRIGASDKLSKGLSTFMVEMTETANILNNATSKSLIILDEIGRGTSTYDGISIARAVAEYLLTNAKTKAKTLFATHYFELLDLASTYSNVKNYTVEIKEINGTLLFMRKVHPGSADKSYGIHVAQLAGMPHKVIQRAKKILKDLESTNQLQLPIKTSMPNETKKNQLQNNLSNLFNGLKLEEIRPIEALVELEKIKQLVDSSGSP